MALTREQAIAVWEVLTEECDAQDWMRDEFMHYVCRPDALNFYEFRFMGALGFGGKFHISPAGHWYVSCYREDRTPEREAMQTAANARLDALAGAAAKEGAR